MIIDHIEELFKQHKNLLDRDTNGSSIIVSVLSKSDKDIEFVDEDVDYELDGKHQHGDGWAEIETEEGNFVITYVIFRSGSPFTDYYYQDFQFVSVMTLDEFKKPEPIHKFNIGSTEYNLYADGSVIVTHNENIKFASIDELFKSK